jgi:DNA (cytosine-5)-methyltransferase 1
VCRKPSSCLTRACALSELRSYAKNIKLPLALDLFSGAGGLSLGLEDAGFKVVLGVDQYAYAVATHRAYFGGVSLCADLSEHRIIKTIGDALEGLPIALIAGGPPCQPFSRAGKNKVRSLGRSWNGDKRRELWRSFAELVDRLRPRAILVENVPDMGFGENSIVCRQLVAAFEDFGYQIFSRILYTWQFGVPQHRQRLILIGVKSGLSFEWPESAPRRRLTVRDAISDLPPVPGGAKDVELHYHGAMNSYQRWCRSGMPQSGKGKVYDQIVRAVRADDLEAFGLMHHGTLYSELPERLRRYRSDIFDDKYKRLPWDGLSRTITAHIGKDGYWYIHPEQHRTLTIREAARIQTFPDRFRFAGTPSHALRQIGEAVPPIFGKALGKAILRAVLTNGRHRSRPSTTEISSALRRWLTKKPKRDFVSPWRYRRGLWHVLLGTVLFTGFESAKSRTSWKICAKRWPSSRAFLKDTKRLSVLRRIGSGSKNILIQKIARIMLGRRGPIGYLKVLKEIPGLPGASDVAFA